MDELLCQDLASTWELFYKQACEPDFQYGGKMHVNISWYLIALELFPFIKKNMEKIKQNPNICTDGTFLTELYEEISPLKKLDIVCILLQSVKVSQNNWRARSPFYEKFQELVIWDIFKRSIPDELHNVLSFEDLCLFLMCST